MLSDEEKKNLLKKLQYCELEYQQDGYLSVGKFEAIKQAIELIEKQQKEIEELKREKAKREWVHIKENGEVEPLFYISEDKIKAKIEEVKDGTYDAKIVLESLLEKE